MERDASRITANSGTGPPLVYLCVCALTCPLTCAPPGRTSEMCGQRREGTRGITSVWVTLPAPLFFSCSSCGRNFSTGKKAPLPKLGRDEMTNILCSSPDCALWYHTKVPHYVIPFYLLGTQTPLSA